MSRRGLLSGLALAASIAWATEPNIPRLEREILFRIDRGPVESALIQFSRQAEIQVVLAPDAPADIIVEELHGRFAASAALAALLKGTGLVYRTVGNTVTVTSSASHESQSLTFTSGDVAFSAGQPSSSSSQGRDP